MLGISGKPWIDLSSVIVMTSDQRMALNREICLGLARLGRECEITGNNKYNRTDIPPDLDMPQYTNPMDALNQLNPQDLDEYKRLTGHSRSLFLMMYKGSYSSWMMTYNLLDGALSWNTKDDIVTSRHPKANAVTNFPILLDWCFKLVPSVFIGIGRIVILGVLPNHHVTFHRDLSPDIWPKDDHFIMLNPGTKTKPLEVYDADTKTRYPMHSRVFTFHDLDYHGADAVPYFTYTVRIDGRFQPAFVAANNLVYRTGLQ